jgi:hypothetical protein
MMPFDGDPEEEDQQQVPQGLGNIFTKPLRSVSRMFVKRGLEDDRVLSKEKIEVDTPTEFASLEREEILMCVRGHLHGPQQTGGVCRVCERYICAACVPDLTCDICGDLVCLDHARVRDGKPICRKHNFLERVLYGMTDNATKNKSPRKPAIQDVPNQRGPQRRTR